MQKLYYSQASGSAPQLLHYPESGTPILYDNIDSLIIDSGSYEILAKSGSEVLIRFPIENTNIYYGTGSKDGPIAVPSYDYFNPSSSFFESPPDYSAYLAISSTFLDITSEYTASTGLDRKSTRLNSSHTDISRMPSSA